MRNSFNRGGLFNVLLNDFDHSGWSGISVQSQVSLQSYLKAVCRLFSFKTDGLAADKGSSFCLLRFC